jgi:5-(aminomethyl)-3-furanmethanol phosphate kinase
MARGPGLVVKVGGSLAEGDPVVDAACSALASGGVAAGALVVPGGGPFAEAVRAADRALGLGATAAHRMAILAMDQYGLLLAHRIGEAGGSAAPVRTPASARAALARGDLPVLLPAGWLESADPLPHSWDVTSDSIAAWVAGACGAPRLVLVKRAPAAAGRLADLVARGYLDRNFPSALRPGVPVWLVDATAAGAVEAALAGREATGVVVVKE